MRAGLVFEQPSLRVALPLLACALAPRPLGRSALAQIGPSGIVGDLEGVKEVIAHARHVDAELGEQLVRDAAALGDHRQQEMRVFGPELIESLGLNLGESVDHGRAWRVSPACDILPAISADLGRATPRSVKRDTVGGQDLRGQPTLIGKHAQQQMLIPTSEATPTTHARSRCSWRPDVEIVAITTTIDPAGKRAWRVGHCLELVGREGILRAAGAAACLTTPRLAQPP